MPCIIITTCALLSAGVWAQVVFKLSFDLSVLRIELEISNQWTMIGIVDCIDLHRLQFKLLGIEDMVQTEMQMLVHKCKTESTASTPPGIAQPVTMISIDILIATMLNSPYALGPTLIIEIATDDMRFRTISERIGYHFGLFTPISVSKLQIFVDIMHLLPFPLSIVLGRII